MINGHMRACVHTIVVTFELVYAWKPAHLDTEHGPNYY